MHVFLLWSQLLRHLWLLLLVLAPRAVSQPPGDYFSQPSDQSSVVASSHGLDRKAYRIKSSFVLPESLASVWELQAALPPPNSAINLTFHLLPDRSNTQKIESILLSNIPVHPSWSRDPHLSRDDVARLAAPRAHAHDRIRKWLDLNGLSALPLEYEDFDAHRSKLLLPNITISQAETLLATQYRVYRHRNSGTEIVRALEYSLPISLHDDVGTVQPTNYFGNKAPFRLTSHLEPLPSRSTLAVTEGFDYGSNVTLASLKALYNLSSTPATSFVEGNALGISGYLEQYANLADLSAFYQTNLPAAANGSLSVVLLNGAQNSQESSQAGIEANLDVQYGGGISYPIPNVFYSTYGRGHNTLPNISYQDNGNEPYDILLSYLLSRNDSDLPKVLSTSYGEFEDEVPLDYAQTVCMMYAQLGARGVSVLHSSGDWGAGVASGDSLRANPYAACSNPNRFKVVFPASCPYVTAVGGTFLVPETTNGLSGGGFSDYFSRPSYQEEAVGGFLTSLGSTYDGMFNSSGRGIPDVSAQSNNFQVFIGGVTKGVSGTSASTPVVAGIIALLNDELLKQGRKTLGFLNPLLYTIGKAGLNDVVTGNNPGCGTNGWNATSGWDPATGNGTPNYGLLRDVVLASNYSDETPVISQTSPTSSSLTTSGASFTSTNSAVTGAAARVSPSQSFSRSFSMHIILSISLVFPLYHH